MTNKRVILEKEDHRSGAGTITKCPFALIRNPKAQDVVLVLRDPRDVITSRSHERWKGKYVFGWERHEGKGPYGLEAVWRSMKPHLETAEIVSYYELVANPDAVQAQLSRRFGLEYDRPFSQWPEGFQVRAYWEMNGLGEKRPIHKARRWTDSPQDVDRVDEITAKHPEFQECVESVLALLEGKYATEPAWSCL